LVQALLNSCWKHLKAAMLSNISQMTCCSSASIFLMHFLIRLFFLPFQ